MVNALGIERRQLLKLIAATGAAGSSAWPAWAAAMPPRGLPASTLMIGTGGAGCKAVRRAIRLGFDPSGFATIDSDPDELAASGAAHQIQCGVRDPIDNWVRYLAERAEDEAQVDALLQKTAKVVLVGGLGGYIGAFWLWRIAARDGLASSYMTERGMGVEVVTTLPRGDLFINDRFKAVGCLGVIREHRALKLRVGFEDDWRFKSGLTSASLPEREAWLTRESLLCALSPSEPSLSA